MKDTRNSGTSRAITGLPIGHTYSFKVAAKSLYGFGKESAPSENKKLIDATAKDETADATEDAAAASDQSDEPAELGVD